MNKRVFDRKHRNNYNNNKKCLKITKIMKFRIKVNWHNQKFLNNLKIKVKLICFNKQQQQIMQRLKISVIRKTKIQID